MAIGNTKSHLRIEKGRHWENYESLKKHWGHSGKLFREVIFNGVQTSTNAAAEVLSGHGGTIAFNAADTMVYLATEADDSNQDGKSVWIDYADSDGYLYENVETKLDSVTSTATEVPIGCESGTFVDPVASRQATGLTMTATVAPTIDCYKGWFVVACGDATHQEGNYLEIESNEAGTPLVCTTTAVPDADWADDNVSIQEHVHPDVYRIRRMWSEVESATGGTKAIHVCDLDSTNLYGVIADNDTYGSAGSRYFALSDRYRCFLGHVHIEAPHSFGADTDDLNYTLTITFTPKGRDNPGTLWSGTKDGAGADITLAYEFIDSFDWQPCIELEALSNVIFKIHKVQNQEHSEVSLDYTILEVGAN